jgi:hypothetical protein
MNVIIERLNGTQYSLADYGVKTLDFVVDSPEPRADSEQAEGLDGHIDLGATYAGRTMHGDFMMQAVDTADYPLLRNEVFRIFQSREQFYVIDEREPGKRWLVRVDGKFSMQQVRVYGRFTVDFISPSAYAESVGTSLTSMDFEQDGVWQVGQGLVEADDLKYTHTTTTFSIYNPGDATVNPRNMPLVITYKGASTNLEIRNLTTLETWKYTGTTASTLETLAINGTRSLKNGVVNIFADTNRKLITLAPGWNSFDIGGTSGSFEVSFNFRFYYL